MIQRELIYKIANNMSVKPEEVRKFLKGFTQAILAAVKDEKTISTELGTFKVLDRPAHKGRNPQTGEEMDIPACKVVRFSAGKALREATNSK